MCNGLASSAGALRKTTLTWDRGEGRNGNGCSWSDRVLRNVLPAAGDDADVQEAAGQLGHRDAWFLGQVVGQPVASPSVGGAGKCVEQLSRLLAQLQQLGVSLGAEPRLLLGVAVGRRGAVDRVSAVGAVVAGELTVSASQAGERRWSGGGGVCHGRVGLRNRQGLDAEVTEGVFGLQREVMLPLDEVWQAGQFPADLIRGVYELAQRQVLNGLSSVWGAWQGCPVQGCYCELETVAQDGRAFLDVSQAGVVACEVGVGVGAGFPQAIGSLPLSVGVVGPGSSSEVAVSVGAVDGAGAWHLGISG
jgi:hypothetical protein